MAGTARNLARRSRWLIGAAWMAGISIVLVEMQMAMDYVQARVVAQAKIIAGWLPMIGTLFCNLTGFLLPRSAGAQSFTRLLLLSAIPVALAAAGSLLTNRAAGKQDAAN